jgi:hypothetical protein
MNGSIDPSWTLAGVISTRRTSINESAGLHDDAMLIELPYNHLGQKTVEAILGERLAKADEGQPRRPELSAPRSP